MQINDPKNEQYLLPCQDRKELKNQNIEDFGMKKSVPQIHDSFKVPQNIDYKSADLNENQKVAENRQELFSFMFTHNNK